MKYSAQVSGRDVTVEIGNKGISINDEFLDYADLKHSSPNNHNINLELLSGRKIVISMLGFSFDGFWDKLQKSYENRCLESMFIEEQVVMRCEGEYMLPAESGRGTIILYPDSICILPPSDNSVRLAFSQVEKLSASGYTMTVSMLSGKSYTIGKMGYDTKFFFERAEELWKKNNLERARIEQAISVDPPYTVCGLFRTCHPEQYWTAAVTDKKCALELHTGEDSATYLYEFDEPKEVFVQNLSEALEAMSANREIIYISLEALSANPLYRMAVARCNAAVFLRSKFTGRLIHNEGHSQRLLDFLK